MNIDSVIPNEKKFIKIKAKTFMIETDKQSIYQACQHILQKHEDNLYEYNIDGLIFTPMLYGVGSDKENHTTRPTKTTWEHSFKWITSRI